MVFSASVVSDSSIVRGAALRGVILCLARAAARRVLGLIRDPFPSKQHQYTEEQTHAASPIVAS